jgi:hypothetical protein
MVETHINYIDRMTKEIKNDIRYSKQDYYKKFTQIKFPDTFLILISHQEKLKALGLAVFCYLMENIDRMNNITCSADLIARELAVKDKESVRKKLKILNELQIIKNTNASKKFTSNSYAVNADLCWKNNVENMGFAKLRMQLFIDFNYNHFGKDGLDLTKYMWEKRGLIIPRKPEERIA